jgi:hypothetical protein
MSDEPSGLVYRDVVTVRTQAAYVEDLLADLAAVAVASSSNLPAALMRALLSSAALEGALADAGDPLSLRVMTVSDQVASVLADVTGDAAPGLPPPVDQDQHRRQRWEHRGWSELAASMAALRASRPLRSSRPEGVAYHGLDPARFAAAAASLPGDAPVMVVGIRTAGVALSTLTATALARQGRRSERLTVRPTGHPHDRRLALGDDLRQTLARAARAGHDFLVVAQGPGLSGSSFLAVGEALLSVGVPAARINFFGTRSVDPATLVSSDPLRRWRQFSYRCWVPGDHWVQPGERDLSGGRWRSVLAAGSLRPPVWPEAERLKALTSDGRSLRKFEGLGRYGSAVHRRTVCLAEAGQGPMPLGPPSADGFVTYRLVAGRPLSLADRTPARTVDIARYIAARPRLCPADSIDPGGDSALGEALCTNVSLVLGRPFIARDLPMVVRPAVVDGRMAPHEWIASVDGRLIKTDAVDHGDDHFLPGPTDIAWDLAGTIVEWDLSPVERALLLDVYQRSAGDDPRERLPAYLLAYASFRARLAALAARSANPQDSARWRELEQHYVSVVQREVSALAH